jgi:DNA-binding transcriptional regulator LsrR (DeoR family)
MSRIDELRLMTKVAHLYYVHKLKQADICEQLGLHQSTISRLLKRAERDGIVRVTVSAASGIHPELEDALQSEFGLRSAIVVDCSGDEAQIARDLGSAAAYYLETTLKHDDVIGISAWSAALLGMVNAMHGHQRWKSIRVVQILGGVGSPDAEVHATQLTRRLAQAAGGTATLLPAPGVTGTADARRVLLKDPFVREAVSLFRAVTVAMVGIGAIEPSRAIASSGNVFSPRELKHLAHLGAVGDICLRFFDAHGRPVASPMNERVISMELSDLVKVRRVVAVAGGRRKLAAIRGALAGKLVNELITDVQTAEHLVGRARGLRAVVRA